MSEESKKTAFHHEIIQCLRALEMLPVLEAEEKHQTGEYHHVCFMKTYWMDGDNVPHRLMLPTKIWGNFLEKTDSIFNSLINRKLLQSVLNENICPLKEFPFDDVTIEDHAKTITKIVWRNYTANYTVLIPLYNISIDKNISEVQLANTILYPSLDDSLYASKISHPELVALIENQQQDKAFLKIEVRGDFENITRQVQLEAKQALMVLRYAAVWRSETQGVKRARYNPASVVNLYESGDMTYIYFDPLREDARSGWYGGRKSIYFLRKNGLDTAKEYYGLDDINYHFKNQKNTISRDIVNFLSFYDSGTQASTNWQALYRYTVCINGITLKGTNNQDDMLRNLRNLIEFGGNYVGKMGEDSEGSEILKKLTWSELVERTAKPFEKFYKLRNGILHGNISEPTDDQTEQARRLAHNAVRLFAFLARKFNWQNHKQVKAWYSNPQPPPET